MLELLYSGEVRALLSVAIIPVAAFLLFVAIVYVLYLLTSPRQDVAQLEKYKLERYEAGNPGAKGDPRRAVSMQYFGYLVLFLAVEPALVIFALTLLASSELYVRVFGIYFIILAIFIPFLIYGVRESRRVESWALE